jgi:hypothetical protein
MLTQVPSMPLPLYLASVRAVAGGGPLVLAIDIEGSEAP